MTRSKSRVGVAGTAASLNELELLDASFLRERIDALGLKQWWLAEQIGVDRKTVPH